jgi:membrane-associated HD superfamily phosphohydrolase
MKKSNFIALVLGTISGVFFGLGMCMALLPEWNALKPGIAVGSIGLLLGLITAIVWRKMEHKPTVKFSGKMVLTVCLGILAALTLGVGMSFVMVWENLIIGIIIGLIGIVLLLSLIPVIKGLK